MMCCCPDPGDGAAVHNGIGGREENYKGRRIKRFFFLFVPPSFGRCCPPPKCPRPPVFRVSILVFAWMCKMGQVLGHESNGLWTWL
ncbi:hypothetical protein SLE2022_169630 [Rubroshorea leprosula]